MHTLSITPTYHRRLYARELNVRLGTGRNHSQTLSQLFDLMIVSSGISAGWLKLLQLGNCPAGLTNGLDPKSELKSLLKAAIIRS